MNQIIGAIDRMHEERKERKDKINDLSTKREIINVIMYLKMREFRKLRDTMFELSFPRSENILEKANLRMEEIDKEMKELENKKKKIEVQIREITEEIEIIEGRLEKKQKQYPELVFNQYRV